MHVSAKRKKSRWGDESDKVDLGPANPNPKGRSTELLMYAQRVFGSTDLEDHQWKQCEDQLKVRLLPLIYLLALAHSAPPTQSMMILVILALLYLRMEHRP